MIVLILTLNYDQLYYTNTHPQGEAWIEDMPNLDNKNSNCFMSTTCQDIYRFGKKCECAI